MWKILRRTTLIFPPVRRLRNQLHQYANQVEQLTRELHETRAQRESALESARSKQLQGEEPPVLPDERTRELEEARRQNALLADRVQQLEARCDSLERDYFAAIDAQNALLSLTNSQVARH
jgi:hypothetical protein